jgi:hypothetical protein
MGVCLADAYIASAMVEHAKTSRPLRKLDPDHPHDVALGLAVPLVLDKKKPAVMGAEIWRDAWLEVLRAVNKHPDHIQEKHKVFVTVRKRERNFEKDTMNDEIIKILNDKVSSSATGTTRP